MREPPNFLRRVRARPVTRRARARGIRSTEFHAKHYRMTGSAGGRSASPPPWPPFLAIAGATEAGSPAPSSSATWRDLRRNAHAPNGLADRRPCRQAPRSRPPCVNQQWLKSMLKSGASGLFSWIDGP